VPGKSALGRLGKATYDGNFTLLLPVPKGPPVAADPGELAGAPRVQANASGIVAAPNNRLPVPRSSARRLISPECCIAIIPPSIESARTRRPAPDGWWSNSTTCSVGLLWQQPCAKPQCMVGRAE
jgi:hypothetical protein